MSSAKANDELNQLQQRLEANPEDSGARHAMAEIITGQAARWCGNILAEVQMNYGRFLPEGAKKELHTAVVALAKFDAELIIGVQRAGTKTKKKTT